MPTYRYLCPKGHETQEWHSIHEDTVREIPCGECSRVAKFAVSSPAIAADALPNKMHGVRAANAQDERWSEDMPAYKRLRDEGLHPKSVDGARMVEQQAQDPLEVTMGRPLGKHLSEAKELHAELLQNDPRKKGAEVGKALREGTEVPV